jgi:hypothetical protein
LGKFFTLLLIPWALHAQDHPQFVWQGEVDGIDVLYLHANKLDVQVQEGAPVARQRFQFHDQLPEVRQDARLEVREGRGYVHIIDQPRLENHFTLGVSIEDRQPGRSFYSIALFWDTSNRFFEGGRHSRSDQVAWSGRVDEEAIVSCQGKRCVSSALKGAPVAAERFKFSKPLPARYVDVRLDSALGRGQIVLVEQPRERNNYTARVSIRDPQAGSGEYSFTLGWNVSSGGNAPEPPDAARGMIWTGAVEGRIRVTVQGGSSLSEVVQGRPIGGERADFLRPLPSSAELHPVVRKLRGRGRVEMVEYPSAANHFRLVFEIIDTEGGADNYEVEVDW